ncbi:hypothetical protein HH1059_14260 [Halorhodospira halochloris]|uniref:Uncharacterized protein n=1 Tax=Halorhodospira halochloris TaxID=1052 RepID=A0A2Z6EZL5_HALHR|nr:hypothetical protein HH1059_14260 [Halorhodospira halochloris]
MPGSATKPQHTCRQHRLWRRTYGLEGLVCTATRFYHAATMTRGRLVVQMWSV